MDTRHHLIVGGSAAGVAAALALRSHGFDGRVTLVEADGEVPYERPPLSKSFTDLDVPRPIVPASTYADQSIELVLGTRVTGLDESSRTVELDDGKRIRADSVVLATGVSARRLGIPGEELDHVLVLRDLADARAMADRLGAGGPLVIIGGGFIGLEAAAVARQRGLDVTVVETTPAPLAGALGVELARYVQHLHTRHGVRILTSRTAKEFRGFGRVEQVLLDDGTVLDAATVLVGCGVVPNDQLAREAGVYVKDGIVIDAYGQTSVPWIRAAGDVTNFVSPFTGRRQRIEHWDVAQRQGAATGANLAGVRKENLDVPYFWSDQYGKRLQMYGRARTDDQYVVRPAEADTALIGFWLRGERLVAAAAIDAPKELRASKPLIETGVPVTAAQLADPGVSLRSLSRPQVTTTSS